MKRKRFKNAEGVHFYDHYTGTDLFDIDLFPRHNKKHWKHLLNYTGQNAERKAKSKCTSVFNHAMQLLFDELIDKNGYVLLGIWKMGYICKEVEESDQMIPETLNRVAKIKICINHDFASQIKRKYYVRLTKRGRIKLVNSIKVRKRGTIR